MKNPLEQVQRVPVESERDRMKNCLPYAPLFHHLGTGYVLVMTKNAF